MAGNPRLEVEIGAITSDLKRGLSEARAELRKFSKEASSTDYKTALQAERLEAAKARTEAAQYRSEIAKLALEHRQNKKSIDASSDSLVGMRARLNELRGIYDRLTASQRNSNKVTSNLVPEIQRLNNSISQSEQVTGRYQRQVGNYALGLGNASGVTMEFSRIIQDAPYGMMGIGNNIQQLTANWQQYVEASKQASAAQGKTVTTGALLRNALSSLLSPASLLTLSIAALTSGWVLYEKWQQRSKKASEETKKTLTSYIETLNGVSRAQADGQASALKELTTVEQLYKATQNVNLPMKDRIENAKELIKQGGELFKSTTAEAVVAGRASSAYDALTNSIRQTAMAQAYMQKMTDNATKALNNNLNILNEANEIMKLNQQIARQESITTAGQAVGAGSESMESANVRALNSLYDQRQERINSINNLNKENAGVLKEQDLLQKGINTAVDNGGKIVDSNNSKLRKTKDKLSEIKKLSESITRDSLNAYDQKLFDISKKYDEIFSKIKDDGLLRLARENMEAEKLRVNMEKFLDLTKKISDSSITPTVTPTLSGVPNIQPLLDSRAGKRASTPPKIDFTTELSKEVAKGISRGIGNAFSDLYTNIGNLGSNFYQVFSNVFDKLSGYVGNVMSDVLGRALGEQLTSRIESGADLGALGSKTGQAIVLGATMAGKVLGGFLNRESAAGQGVAGALSGAASGLAAGAAIGGKSGGIWGAAIGGVVGLIGGIFGAKSAKREREKQEQLQAAQLAEQKKQTALMERAQMLAYTASVVGQMTNNGVVTSVERDAFGNLVADIKGKDIQLVLERNKSGR